MQGKDFNEPLCGCTNDWTSCLIGSCVPCGLVYLQAKAVDTVTNDGMLVPCLLNFIACIGWAINRGKIRERFEYQGNFCGDCILHYFCHCCATLQEYREVQNRLVHQH